MAKQTIEVVQCDITGTEGARTRTIELDGWVYEIDLCDEEDLKLLRVLTPLMEAGRRIGRTAKPPTAGYRPGATLHKGPTQRDLADALNVPQVRDWWRSYWRALKLPPPSNGGRLPDVVKEAWAQRHSAVTQQTIHDYANRPTTTMDGAA